MSYPERDQLEFCLQFPPSQSFLAADRAQVSLTVKESTGVHLSPGQSWGPFLVRLLLKPGPALRSVAAVEHARAVAFPNRTSSPEALPLGTKIPGLRGRMQWGENVLYSGNALLFSIFPGWLCPPDFSVCKH